MDKLNNKIVNGRSELINEAQMVANYAYDSTEDRLRRVEVNSNGALSVDVHGGSVGSGDMKARTTIADPSTSTFVKCNTDGTLEMTAELSSAGLATSVIQTDGSQKATVGNTVGDGSGTAKHLLTNATGELMVNLGSSTTQNVNLIANDGPDGTGASRVVGCNSNGFLKVKDDELETNFVSGLFSTQMMGRTTIGDTSTRKNLLCDADGHLQVECLGNTVGDGSGTATHLKTASDGSVHVVVENSDNVLIKGIQDGTTTQKDAKTNSNGDLRSALIGNTAKDGTGTNYYVLVDADGKLETSGGGGGGSAPANTYSNTAVSVLAPTGGAFQAITTSGNIELTNARNITITLYSTELSTVLGDVTRVGLEYSYDGITFFTNLSSAGSPSFQPSNDIAGNPRLDPVSSNPILIDQSIFPDQDRGKFVRVSFLHTNSAGSNVDIVPVIVLNGA